MTRATTAAPGAAPDDGAASQRWAREVFAAGISQARSMVSLVEAMQQTHALAWDRAIRNVQQALQQMEEAEDAAALAAVPRHWSSAQWLLLLEGMREASRSWDEALRQLQPR